MYGELPWYKQVADCEVHVQMDRGNVITSMLSIHINMHLGGFSRFSFHLQKMSKEIYVT